MSSPPTRLITPVPASPSGGLGRGLAGILDDSRLHQRHDRPGLQQLLGRTPSLSPPRVRQFVADTAAGFIAEGFDAEAVVLARRESHDRHTLVSSRIPPSWDDSSAITFELFGQLWRLLDRSVPPGPWAEQISLAGHHGWMGRQPSVNGDLVAAVVRTRPFSDEEETTLSRVIRSVAVAIGPNEPILPPGTRLSVSVEPEGAGWRAEVSLAGARGDLDRRTRGSGDHEPDPRPDQGARQGAGESGASDGVRRRGTACDPRRELAVARAAAQLCGVPCHVAFAGRTSLEDSTVTIVVVNDRDGSPLLGLSMSEHDSCSGPAEAVLAAMAAVGDLAL